MITVEVRPVFGLMLLLVTLVGVQTASADTPVPKPQSVQMNESVVGLPASPTIAFSTSNPSSRMTFLQTYLQNGLTTFSGGFTEVGGNSDVHVHLHRFDDPAPPEGLAASIAPFPQIGSEGYVLLVEPNGAGVRVTIAADDDHGLWNGGMTALQLLLVAPEGPSEASVTPQLIRDFPDHPIRAVHLMSLNMPKNNGVWELTSTIRDRIDEMARLKINRMETSQGNAAFIQEDFADFIPAFAQAQEYADDRFVQFATFSGDLRNGAPPRYMDGWWTHREGFAFEPRVAERVPNPGFEVDLDSDGFPDSWFLVSIDPNRGAWSVDTTESYLGDVSMRIDVAPSAMSNPPLIPSDPNDPNSPLIPNPQSSTNLRVIHSDLPVLNPGLYRVRACFKSLNIQSLPLQVTFFATSSGNPAQIGSVFSDFGTTSGWICRTSGQQPISIDANTSGLGLYTRINDGGSGTAWVDEIEIVEVEEISPGVWQEVAATPVHMAVPILGAPNLVANPSFEAGLQPDGVTPIDWNLATVDPNYGTWTLDTTVARTGTASMRLYVPDSDVTVPGQPNSSEMLRVSQLITGDIPGGLYRATAWMRTENVQPHVSGLGAQLTVHDNDPQQLFLGNPTGPLGTQDWTQISAFVRVPDGHDQVGVYSRINENGTGTIWLDDISIQRVSGDLRNVPRSGYNIVVESVGGATRHIENIDYEVIDGALELKYEPDLIPTEIRLLPGSAIDPNGEVWISYDSQLYWSELVFASQAPNICSTDVFNEYFAPQVDQILNDIEAVSSIPYSPLLAINIDEIHGFNRSGACHTLDGELARPNGQVLADHLNAYMAEARSHRPDLRFWGWHDMFTPVRNGGRGYEFKYGGDPGATICAVEPTHTECLLEDQYTSPPLDPDMILVYWNYGDTTAYEFEGSRFLHEDLGHDFMVAPGNLENNIRDWAALAVGEPKALGMMRTPYANEDNLDLSADLFWNAPWQRVFFAPFAPEPGTQQLPTGYALAGNAVFTNDGTCARTSAKIFKGGVCLGPGTSSVTLPTITVRGSTRYGAWLRVRAATNSTLSVQANWNNSSDSQNLVVADTGGGFARVPLTVDPLAFTSPPDANQLTLNVSSSDAVALDSVVIWQERLVDAVCTDPNSDSDSDGVSDVCDNCPDDPNPDQEDANGDGVGDACSPCPNNCDDGLDCTRDTCIPPGTCVHYCDVGLLCGEACGINLTCGIDANGACSCSGSGSPCQASGDQDQDGVCDALDNCTEQANPIQVDADFDGYGNACDCDQDQDGDCDLIDHANVASCVLAGGNVEPLHDPNCTESDMTEDGLLDIDDIVRSDTMRAAGLGPGPSALIGN